MDKQQENSIRQNKISVVINTYNAEAHLREVLETVKGFDEVVVCDMESTDSTLEIAREYGCRVVVFPRKDNRIVEPARNFAIHQASFKWTLVVDADELVTPELREYLYERICEPDCPAGFLIPRQNHFMGIPQKRHIGDHQLRFFDQRLTFWPPYIHSVPVVKGTIEKLEPHGNIMLVHLAENTIHEVAEKANRYTDEEMKKRTDKHYGVGALIWRPLWRFFKAYILKGKFREGIRGLIDSILTAYYQFLLVSKVIEYNLITSSQAAAGKEKCSCRYTDRRKTYGRRPSFRQRSLGSSSHQLPS